MKSLRLTNHKVGIGIIAFLFITLVCSALTIAGTISGRVTDGTSGVPAWVYIYSTADQYSYIGYAQTDNNGDYTATGLAAGNYKIKFDPDTGYISEWYNDQVDFNSADITTITDSATVADINAVLEVGGSISGKMTDSGGAGLSGQVYVYNSTDSYPYVADTNTDAAGNYFVTGLANGDYKVNFEPDGNYLGNWYNNKGDFNSADIVTVTVPDTTTNIDAVLSSAGAISGRMTNASEAGLPGDVYLHEDLGGYSQIHSARADADGNYTFTGLRTSTHYKINFQPDGSYASEWYNDKMYEEAADTIAVTAPDTTTGVDAVLADGGTISGRITNAAGEGIAGVSPSVYDMDDNTITGEFYNSTSTDVNGEYTITNLPVGEYKILFSGYTACYSTEWYGDKPDFANAVPVLVTALNTTPNIDAVLAPSGSISGRVTDAAEKPVASLWVSAAYSATFGTQALSRTDSNGEYKLCGLDTGSYKVHFEALGELDEWYNNKPDFESADSIAVTEPNNTPGIDAVLEPEQATVPITPMLMLLLQK